MIDKKPSQAKRVFIVQSKHHNIFHSLLPSLHKDYNCLPSRSIKIPKFSMFQMGPLQSFDSRSNLFASSSNQLIIIKQHNNLIFSHFAYYFPFNPLPLSQSAKPLPNCRPRFLIFTTPNFPFCRSCIFQTLNRVNKLNTVNFQSEVLFCCAAYGVARGRSVPALLQVIGKCLWNSQEFHNNIYLPPGFPFALMQKLNLFQAISPQILATVHNDQLCLESAVFLNRDPSKQLRIALTNSYLVLAEQDNLKNAYRYYTPLDNQLKFQAVYEQDQQSPSSELSPTSRRVGFILTRADASPVEFILSNQSMVDIWIKYLTRCLNQLGFHRLYKPVKKLGKGGFATVYEVERLTDRCHFAVKAFSKQNTIRSQNQSQRLTLLNEIKIMRELDSPHVIKLEAVFESDNSLYVVLELLTAGQLHSRINKRQGEFTLGEIKQFMIGLVKGLKEIHDNGIMHRDIKPENIMLRNENNLDPVIVDFGLAAYVESEDYIFYRCGTPGYVAPEITTLAKGQKASPVCDVFSAGVIFHILLVKKPLFEGRKFEEVYENNRKMRFNLNSSAYQKVDPEAMDLLAKMLKVDPKQRITPAQILQHPFLYGWMMEDEKEELSPTSTLASCKNKCERAY